MLNKIVIGLQGLGLNPWNVWTGWREGGGGRWQGDFAEGASRGNNTNSVVVGFQPPSLHERNFQLHIPWLLIDQVSVLITSQAVIYPGLLRAVPCSKVEEVLNARHQV